MQFILLAAFMCCANTENNFPFAADTAMASVRLLSQVIVLSLMLPACSEPRQDLRLRYATQLDTARPVAAFQLRAQDDSAFTNDNLLGHWSLIFSGFTFCPDICPLTLGQLQAAEQQMTGPRRHQVIFVTVDPERDTAASLKQYLQLFQQHWIGLTGAQSELSTLLNSLGMAQVRIPQTASSQYSIEHSTAIVLLDPQGRMTAYWKAPFDTAQLAADFSALPAVD